MAAIRTPVAALAAFLALAVPLVAQTAREREEARREEWQKVDAIFAAMALKPGATVADVGAGRGFFTSRLARMVGEQGRVYAVEIAADELKRLRARVAEEQLTNVEVIEGAADDPKLPPGSLDAALIVNTYHEMKHYEAMLAALKTALKPGGRLVIVEPISPSRRSASRDVQVRSHEIGAEFVQQEARQAGFAHVQLHDPFTARSQGHDEEWMLVLTPARRETESTAPRSEDDAWKAPELRMPLDEFKRLAAAGDVLVLDVRDEDMYRDGHLPGAELMSLENLERSAVLDKVKAEKQTIVAYCS